MKIDNYSLKRVSDAPKMLIVFGSILVFAIAFLIIGLSVLLFANKSAGYVLLSAGLTAFAIGTIGTWITVGKFLLDAKQFGNAQDKLIDLSLISFFFGFVTNFLLSKEIEANMNKLTKEETSDGFYLGIDNNRCALVNKFISESNVENFENSIQNPQNYYNENKINFVELKKITLGIFNKAIKEVLTSVDNIDQANNAFVKMYKLFDQNLNVDNWYNKIELEQSVINLYINEIFTTYKNVERTSLQQQLNQVVGVLFNSKHISNQQANELQSIIENWYYCNYIA